jgi:hypothetical protein
MPVEPLRPRPLPRPGTIVGWAIAALVLVSASAITAWQIGRGPASKPPPSNPGGPSPSAQRSAAVSTGAGTPLVRMIWRSGSVTAGGWLDRFVAGTGQRRHDLSSARELAERPSATGQPRVYLRALCDRYDRPIWPTGYALIKFGPTSAYPSGEQQAALIRSATRMLDSVTFLKRYARLALPTAEALVSDEAAL